MKKLVKRTFIFSFSVVLLISCINKEKEDETPITKDSTVTNYLKIGTTKITLGTGMLENYGLSSMENDSNYYYDGYNFDLYLFEKGISIFSDEGEYFPVGNGAYVYFELYSAKGTFLDTGKYTFSLTEPFATKTFDCGVFSLDFETEEDYTIISSGSINVKKSNDIYEITIDCLGDDGQRITGYYKGTLNYADYSEDTYETLQKSAIRRE